MVLRKCFYICWSAGRSPRVHEANPSQDPSKLKLLMSIQHSRVVSRLHGSIYIKEKTCIDTML